VRRLLVLALLAAAGCTAGAPAAGGGSSSSSAGGVTVVDVSLTTGTVVGTAFGTSQGYTPAITTVPLGTMVQFVNRDTFAHTATSVSGASFPNDPGFTSSALTPSGSRLSAGWTSGTLAAGASSPPVLADVAGTYLYGCFFHYSAPMRGAIVVR
jgi:plastocyanin